MVEIERSKTGNKVLASVFLLAAGLAFIPFGMTVLPVIGVASGIGLMLAAIYPWVATRHAKSIKVKLESVADGCLNPRLIVATLHGSSAAKGDEVDFNPVDVEPKSLRLGPQKARPVEDMNDPAIFGRNLSGADRDGVPDLLVVFQGDEAGISLAAQQACIHARTKNGEYVLGCDSIHSVVKSNHLVE